MRLLIYLLAMMTGFSAAEAARPVSATPAALGSAMAQGAAVLASVEAVKQHNAPASASKTASHPAAIALPTGIILLVLASSPITRFDISRQ